EGGRLLAQGRSAVAQALGDDRSGRPAAEGTGRAGWPAGRTWAPATRARPATRAWTRIDGCEGLPGARGGLDFRPSTRTGRAERPPRGPPAGILRQRGVSANPGQVKARAGIGRADEKNRRGAKKC